MEETFGSYIKRLRGSRTKKEIAKVSGFTAEYIRRIEEENKIPSQQILVKLAKGLGIEVKDLVFRALKEKAPKEAKEYFKTIPGKYPGLRKALLSHYYFDTKSGFGDDFYTVIEAAEKIESQSFHFIEEKLTKEIYNFLVKEKAIKGGLDPVKTLTSMDEEELNKKLSEFHLGWTWNFKSKYILINHKAKKEKLSYDVVWAIKKSGQ